MFSLILLAISVIPYGHDVEFADSVELNHVVTGETTEMVQLIFREHGIYRTRIFAWCLPRNLVVGNGDVRFDFNGNFHIVKFGTFNETWTSYDPEIVDRQDNPDRRGLKKSR